MNILCRLGLHNWKPVMVYRFGYEPSRYPHAPSISMCWHWRKRACKCRRCGKRGRL